MHIYGIERDFKIDAKWDNEPQKWPISRFYLKRVTFYFGSEKQKILKYCYEKLTSRVINY